MMNNLNMKGTMKRFIALVSLMLGLSFGGLQAATFTWVDAPNVTNILATGGKLNSVALTSTGAVTTLLIYDSPYITNFVNMKAYTNASVTNYTATYTYTNLTGTTNSYTYSATTNATGTVNAAAKVYPILGMWTAPSNTTVTLTFDNLYFNRGLLLTNTGGGTFTVNYTTSR